MTNFSNCYLHILVLAMWRVVETGYLYCQLLFCLQSALSIWQCSAKNSDSNHHKFNFRVLLISEFFFFEILTYKLFQKSTVILFELDEKSLCDSFCWTSQQIIIHLKQNWFVSFIFGPLFCLFSEMFGKERKKYEFLEYKC